VNTVESFIGIILVGLLADVVLDPLLKLKLVFFCDEGLNGLSFSHFGKIIND